MELPKPHRLTHFPLRQIFGKRIVPVYYCGKKPVIPLVHVADVMNIPFETAFKIVKRNREALDLVDVADCKPVLAAKPLAPIKKRLCLGMDGFCILIFAIDHENIKDIDCRERIIVAKRWLTAQVSNRLKVPGRRNQPRWDAGLKKEQSREMKKRFGRLKKL